MKIKNIGRCLLFSMLYLSSFNTHAQNENKRAADWLTLQRLTTLASLDSSFLSPSDKKTLSSLLIDKSPTAACAKASATPCLSVPLPITGLKLSGKRTSPATAKLDWETRSEYNSKGFVLEKQSLSNPLQFDSIWYTNGQGNSDGPTKYTYTDMNSSSIVTYYRVREVDIDDNFTYSNIVAIDATISGLAVHVAPNPGTSTTAAFYIVGTSSALTGFIITNATGKTIIRKDNIALSGNTYIPLSSYNLARGFYIVTVFNNKEQISQKFIIY